MTVNVSLWGIRIGVLEWSTEQARASFQFSQEYMDSDIDLSPVSGKKSSVWGRTYWGIHGEWPSRIREVIRSLFPEMYKSII